MERREVSNIGQFGVVRTKGFYGEMIRLGTRSQVNHAFIVVDDDGTIVEAEGGGVQVSHLTKYPVMDTTFSKFPFRPEVGKNIAHNALALVGTEYNWIDIGVLTLMSFGLHQKWMVERARNTQQLFCSQLVDLAYRQSGINLFPNKPTGFVVPGDLFWYAAHWSACTAFPEVMAA